MPRGDLYQELYKRLNKAQKQAVDTVEGPVMVIAGPGTGKTQILTLRIANILRETDTDPRSILSLTFTESGVVSMRKRLAEIIGDTAYLVNINTFHGFCNDIIKNYPEEFPRIIGSENINEVEQIRILEKLIEELPLKYLRPFGDKFYYARAILADINQLKREGVSAMEFGEIVRKREKTFPKINGLRHEKGPYAGKIKGEFKELEKQIAKNKELARIYIAYQKELAEKRLYDYSDMIMETLSALKKSDDLLPIIQERFHYFLIDEHQDTNNAQNKIIELLASFYPNPNVFIVGDEKQAIFRFQGASIENFAYFKKLYPSAMAVTLLENYRSTQHILDSAHEVALAMECAGEKLKSQTLGGEKIKLCRFTEENSEFFWIAENISEKIKNETAPQDIAILYRDNKDAFPIAKVLEKIGVPYVIESDQDILDDQEIKKLLALLKAVYLFGSQEAFIEAVHADFLGIHPLDVYKITSRAGERKSKISVFDIISSEKELSELNIQFPEKITGFYKHILLWTKTDKNKSLLSTFGEIIRDSGYINHILALPNPLSAIEKTNAIFNEVKVIVENNHSAKLKDFFEYLETLRTHKIYIKKNIGGLSENRVRLMTAHRSKGQEFEHVYIISAYDGHWGNRRKSNILPLFPEVFSLFETANWAYNEISDERRLFYVALTRAKKEVVISYARENESGKERLASIFIQEIRPELIEIVNTESFEKKLAVNLTLQFAPSKIERASDAELKLIHELFVKNGLSVTHLNNYLKCPWKYFYINLLRIPQAQTKSQMYGTAIHQALKDFFDAMKKDKNPNKDFLLESFLNHIKRQALSDEELIEASKRGENALGGYYDQNSPSWNANVLAELSVDGVSLSLEIVLNGKIDKLEFLGNGDDVVVTDYKTSKPKSRGEIEGTTKSSNGDIKRQLVFYKLLLDKFELGKYRMKLGAIDFIEPDDKGRYHSEKFEIEDGETGELRELILKISDEILNAKFWDKKCDEKDCEFCALRKLIEN
mgnify:CR=1 FL=1